MLYCNNVSDILLLQRELKKLKVLYVEALRKKESKSAIQQLRKRIKFLTSRINLSGYQ